MIRAAELVAALRSRLDIRALVSIAVILGVVAMGTYTVVSRDLRTTVAYAAIDDGLYYVTIARNIVERGMPTVDGVTSTNGFHPLWMMILLPVAFFFRDPDSTLRATFFVAFVVTTLAALFFSRVSRRMHLSAAGILLAAGLLFLNLRSFTTLLSTIEAPIVLLAYLAYANYVLSSGEDRFCRSRAAFLAGLLGGVAFLARTDSVFLLVGYAVLLVLRVVRGRVPFATAARSAGFASLGALLLAGPYLIFNLAVFGHLLSVSGYKKIVLGAAMHQITAPYTRLLDVIAPRIAWITGLPAGAIAVTLLVVGAALVAIVLLRCRRAVGDRLSELGELSILAGAHFVFVGLFMPTEAFVSSWYYLSELLVAALVLGGIIPRARRWTTAALVSVLALYVVQMATYPYFVRKKTMTWAKLEIADHVRERLPENARLAMKEGGITSYFARRDFVILVGLVGDFEQSELLARNDFAALARRYGISYLVLDVPAERVDEAPARVAIRGTIQTPFRRFEEGLKTFVVYSGSPEELDATFRWRSSLAR